MVNCHWNASKNANGTACPPACWLCCKRLILENYRLAAGLIDHGWADHGWADHGPANYVRLIMASSIAAVDIAALKSHCYANAAKDPLFCKSPSLFVRMFHALQTIGKDHSASRTKQQDSVITGKMVLVASVGRGLILQSTPKKIDAVMVLAIRNHQHVPPRYHANYLTALMEPDHVGDVDHVELEDGHHFAFIAPFADRVTREETILLRLIR